ncbi:MAG TPA: 1-phosphofructokinase family hexose kinase [Pyrinomonadaceae bacterium]|nr:1-phosphofructokinase family hexose kinase [Pyrinomonadaceae bacterium]
MIICVSANPAVDRRLRIRSLKPGEVNRVLSSKSFAGGKAAHVAMAAKELGARQVVWVGFLGGANGDQIERELSDLGVEVFAVRTASDTRINDEIIDEGGVVTEILEPGGEVTQSEQDRLYERCQKLFAASEGRFQAIFSGSLPPGIPSDTYAGLINMAHECGGSTILDTSGEAFRQGLKAAPGIIKPNRLEAEDVLGRAIESERTAAAAASFRDLGAIETLISLGVDGLVWSNGHGAVLHAKPPEVNVNSTVGCGDATVAGLAIAIEQGLELPERLRLAVAAGSANCLADLPGQIRRAEVERLRPLVAVSDVELST